MSVTVTKLEGPLPNGAEWYQKHSVDFDSSYASAGEPLSRGDLGWKATAIMPHRVLIEPQYGLQFTYDYANEKIRAYAGRDASRAFTYAPGGGDIKGATAVTAAMGTADQAADVVNPGLYSAYTTFTNVNTAVGVLVATAQPEVARNIVISVKNDTGGNLDAYTGTMNFAVVGTFRGAAQTETIAWTLTSGQKTIANTPKYRAVAGVKPFDAITSITVDATSLAAIIVASGGLKVAAGPGALLGFPIDTQNGADTDIVHLSKNNANVSATGAGNYTNKTFTVGTTADGDDIMIVYNADSNIIGGTAYGTAVALAEIPATTDLSAVTGVIVHSYGRFPA